MIMIIHVYKRLRFVKQNLFFLPWGRIYRSPGPFLCASERAGGRGGGGGGGGALFTNSAYINNGMHL